MRKILKILGITLISFSGILSLYHIKNKTKNKVEILDEFIKHLEFMYTQISFYKMPLYEIFKRLSEMSGRELRKLYIETLNKFENKEMNPFKNAFKDFNFLFGKNETIIINDFANELGNTNYDNQLKTVNACSSLLKKELESLKEYIGKNSKTQSTLLINIFIVIVILVI